MLASESGTLVGDALPLHEASIDGYVPSRHPIFRHPWRMILLTTLPVWTGVAITRMSTFMLTEDRNPGVFLVAMLPRSLHMLAVLLVALGCYRLALQLRWERGRRARAAIGHALLALAVAFASRPLLIWLAASLDPAFRLDPHWLNHFTGQGMRYWIISGSGFAFAYLFGLALLLGARTAVVLRDAQLHTARLHNQWMQSRLQVLRMQINPHFIFNALNTIASELEQQPQRARSLIVAVGDLFRRALQLSDEDWIRLREECDFAEAYMSIQAARFGGRLQFSVELQEGVEALAIPTLLLQPLIENAVVHGVAGGGQHVRVWLRGSRVVSPELGDCLRMEVGNRSSSPLATDGDAARVGLGNTRARLTALFGPKVLLRLSRPDGCTFVAGIELPLAALPAVGR